jgi:hypothetical protein
MKLDHLTNGFDIKIEDLTIVLKIDGVNIILKNISKFELLLIISKKVVNYFEIIISEKNNNFDFNDLRSIIDYFESNLLYKNKILTNIIDKYR